MKNEAKKSQRTPIEATNSSLKTNINSLQMVTFYKEHQHASL